MADSTQDPVKGYTEERFRGDRKKVFRVLERYPEARDESPLLTILYVWRDEDGLPGWIIDLILAHKIKYGLSDTENIRRAKQILQNNKGVFKPSDVVAANRAERAQTMKKLVRE